MICQKCKKELPESEIQLSHDIPKYVGGTDKDGRHNLCKKCHDIYERLIFSIMVKSCSEEIKKEMISKAKIFSKHYFTI